MSDKNRPGMGFEVNIRSARKDPSQSETSADTPFCMAVLGDFTGRSNQVRDNDRPLAQRKLIAIDRDNFDEVLAKLKPSITIRPDDQSQSQLHIEISALDDFHPDSLFDRLEIFSKLRGIRRRLKNKASFDEAASEIMGWLVEETPGEQASTESPDTRAAASIPQENLLDSILGATPQASSELEQLTSPTGLDQLVKQIIAPYVEPSTNPRQPEMLAAVDEAIAGHMRDILHNPQFQDLEATWRSVYFLISRIETDRRLKIYLLDVSRSELEEDLATDAETSSLHKRFCEPAMNETPWSLLVGNYIFDDSIDDVLLLAQLGNIGRAAEAPFIAGAKSTLGGCESFGKYPDADDWQYRVKSGVESAWKMLRDDPVAEYIGLALPRFLLRAPYGKKSSPIDAFSFEEIPEAGEICHECCLWGNAAFIKAEQLARAFSNKHWNMYPGEANQTDSLPMYYFDDDGETQLMPCAEIYLTEKGGKKLSAQGLITLWSVKNMDAIRSSDFNSLAASGSELQGRWVK